MKKLFYVVVRGGYEIIETTANRGVPTDTHALPEGALFATKRDAELFIRQERERTAPDTY